jgi:rsbT antagonist protein RsbS
VSVAILLHGNVLIATVETDLSDKQVLNLRDELADRVGRHRARAVVVDVTGLDVIDSFVARALKALAETVRLRGAETLVVGIQPEVAIAMVQFDLDLHPLRTALDLDEAMAVLNMPSRGDEDGR